MSSSYRSNRLGLSHWDPYTMCRGSCLELYYCNTVEWFWWDSSLISRTNWFSRPRNDLWDVKQPTNHHTFVEVIVANVNSALLKTLLHICLRIAIQQHCRLSYHNIGNQHSVITIFHSNLPPGNLQELGRPSTSFSS